LTLENIGELIAVIATIATLVYLALQIRLNAKATQGSTARSWVEQESATAMFIAQYANIYRRGNADFEELNEDEAVVYTQIITVEIGEVWAGQIQFKSGLISELEMDTYHAMLKNYMEKPGFRSVWMNMKDEYPEEFRQWIDGSALPEGREL
jgi:hypothetical protein